MSAKARAKDLKFVFLVCSERCGSNLISTMLGAHPKVMSPPPYHFARDVIANLYRRDDEAGWRAVKEQLVHRVRRLGDDARADALAAWLEAHPDASAEDLARQVYVDLDPKPGATTVFIKENNLHRVLGFVLTCFPDAKFVFQTRDPRDYLASAKARRGFLGGNKFGSLKHALEVWHEDQTGGLELRALLGPGRVFFQRYEDLVSRPREVLAPLCAFLGLAFDEAMLGFHESDKARSLSGSGSARANVGKPLMADNFGKYRKSLSGGEIRTVEAWLGDLMDRFGYARDFPAGPAGAAKAMGPAFSEPFERLINGETAAFYGDGQKRFRRRLAGTATRLKPDYDAGA